MGERGLEAVMTYEEGVNSAAAGHGQGPNVNHYVDWIALP